MKRREPLKLDMTPLVDVVFLLLIFFLVASVFKKEELALLLHLPTGDAGRKVAKRTSLTIELDQTSMVLDGRKVTFQTLEKVLSNTLLQDHSASDRPVMVRIDRAVSYGRVMRLLDLLKKYRYNNLALMQQSAKKEY